MDVVVVHMTLLFIMVNLVITIMVIKKPVQNLTLIQEKLMMVEKDTIILCHISY